MSLLQQGKGGISDLEGDKPPPALDQNLEATRFFKRAVIYDYICSI